MTLLHRSSGWFPWLAVLVAVAGVLAAIALLVPPGRWRVVGAAGALAGIVALTGGSAAYALDTAATPHTGSTPSAGPAVATSALGGPGGAAPTGGFPGANPPSGSTPPSGGTPPSGFTPPSGPTRPSGTGSVGTRQGGPGGGMDQQAVSAVLTTLLKNAGTTWSAATIGSQSAAPLELQSGTAVIAIGGFSGSDNAPTLAQFKALVAAGKIHYFIGGSGGAGGAAGAGGFAGPGGRGGSGSSAITAWVEKHFTSSTVGGTTVYDLTKAH
jgi:hypothetical protein